MNENPPDTEQIENVAEEPAQDIRNQVWKPWPTAGLGCIVGMALLVTQMAIAVIFIASSFVRNPKADLISVAKMTESNGLYVSIAVVATAIVCLTLIWLFISLRRGASVAEYISLRPVSAKTVVAWVGLTAVFIAISNALLTASGKPTVPQWQMDVYRTSVFPPLLWVSFVLIAPAFEETFFRGFLLEGFRRSRLGNGGAVVLIAILWASIHIQYSVHDIALILVGGMLLGAARIRSGSLLTCYAMHAFVNLSSLVETAIRAR